MRLDVITDPAGNLAHQQGFAKGFTEPADQMEQEAVLPFEEDWNDRCVRLRDELAGKKLPGRIRRPAKQLLRCRHTSRRKDYQRSPVMQMGQSFTL